MNLSRYCAACYATPGPFDVRCPDCGHPQPEYADLLFNSESAKRRRRGSRLLLLLTLLAVVLTLYVVITLPRPWSVPPGAARTLVVLIYFSTLACAGFYFAMWLWSTRDLRSALITTFVIHVAGMLVFTTVGSSPPPLILAGQGSIAALLGVAIARTWLQRQ